MSNTTTLRDLLRGLNDYDKLETVNGVEYHLFYIDSDWLDKPLTDFIKPVSTRVDI